jgi:hypothetical protein
MRAFSGDSEDSMILYISQELDVTIVSHEIKANFCLAKVGIGFSLVCEMT